MNIKRFDRKDQWGNETEKRYFHREFANDDFTGVMALLYFDEVKKSRTWKHLGRTVEVCGKGMKWLQYIPKNENYAVSAMISENNEINLWFVDVIAGHGYTDDNVVYFRDLYVDIILHPGGEYMSDDTDDELKEALAENEVTEELYSLALKTKAELISGILSDTDALSGFCMKYLQEMESC